MNEKIKDREKIAKQIAKTSDSFRALKTGKMEVDIALERHFKLIVEPLKQIVENTVEPVENETFFLGEEEESKPKRKRSNTLFDNSLMASIPVKSMLKQLKTAI